MPARSKFTIKASTHVPCQIVIRGLPWYSGLALRPMTRSENRKLRSSAQDPQYSAALCSYKTAQQNLTNPYWQRFEVVDVKSGRPARRTSSTTSYLQLDGGLWVLSHRTRPHCHGKSCVPQRCFSRPKTRGVLYRFLEGAGRDCPNPGRCVCPRRRRRRGCKSSGPSGC